MEAAAKTDLGTNGKEPVRVLIVDDHPLLRKGVGQLIGQDKSLVVVGEAEDAHKALAIIEMSDPAIALIDIALNGPSGLELLKDIRARFPHIKILVLSMHDEAVYAPRALRAGAAGYVMKQEGAEKVLIALRKVLQGGIYLSERLAGRMLHTLVNGRATLPSSPADELSDRELEVFNLIGRGHGTRPIAQMLRLSVKTVESHRAHIKEKLNFKNSNELVRHAIQWVQSERAFSGADMGTATAQPIET